MNSETLNKKLSKIPLRNITLPKPVRNSLVDMYPVLDDQDNPVFELAWRTIDAFIHGATEKKACHDYIRTLNSSTPVETLLIYLQEALGILIDIDFSYVIPLSNEESKCRVIKYTFDPAFEQLKESLFYYWTNDFPFVYALSGKLQENKRAKKVARVNDNKNLDSSNNFSSLNETLLNMDRYCELVNELVNNQARRKIILDNIHSAKMAIIKADDNDVKNKEHQFRVLNLILNTDPNAYRLPSTISPRIFDGVDQALVKCARMALYAGCYDIDLKRSQIAILAYLSNSEELLEWLEVDIWEELRHYSGLPKWKCKKIVYSQVFGGGKYAATEAGSCEDNFYSSEISRSDVDAVFSHKFFKDIKSAIYTVRSTFKDKRVKVGDHYLEISESGLNRRQAMAYLIQWHESQLMYAALLQVQQMKRVSLMGAFHDGLLLSLAPIKKPESQVQLIQDAVQKRANELGLGKMTLTFEPLK